MPHKQLLFRATAREKLLHGVEALADAVRVTLGPRSKSVLISRPWGSPIVCDDGVTIAKQLSLADPDEDLGVQMIRQAAERTGDAVGDGTSTATLLAAAIFSDGVRNVTAGASAVDLRRGLERGMQAATDTLRAASRPVRTRLEKEQVATLSAHGDESVGALVADAVERVGDEGVISVEEARGTETSVDVVEGMQFARGYLSPYFVTDPERMECVLEDPLILLDDGRITAMPDLLPILEAAAKLGQPLLVVAEDVEGEALATMVVNHIRGVVRCAAVKAPGFGDRRRAMLEDIAVLTGGQLVARELGVELANVRIDMLGRAERVVVDRDATTIIGGKGDRAALEQWIARLRAQIEETTSSYDREKLQERLAKLAGGVAVVRVGAATEAEMGKRKEAVEDAINSTKAAVAEGIVPGGGLALVRAIDAVEQEARDAEGDVRTGLLILRRALEAPARQIAENSGFDAGVVIERMRAGANAVGLDAARGQFVDLIEAGIVDPTKVVRTALENAVSVAGVLLLTEATMTEVPEPTQREATAEA